MGTANVAAKTFDVVEYGAKGDDQTDNTEAFSACMKDMGGKGAEDHFIRNGGAGIRARRIGSGCSGGIPRGESSQESD